MRPGTPPRVVPLALLLALLLHHVHATDVCTTQTQIPHRGVPEPFGPPVVVALPLTLYYICDIHERPRPPIGRAASPLLVLLQGALSRPSQYARLSSELARRGFVVAIPDYTQRLLPDFSPIFTGIGAIENESIAMGSSCPPNGQFSTLALVTSVLAFFTNPDSPLRAVRNMTDVTDTVIFGHSLGGSIASFALNGACLPFSAPQPLPPEAIPFGPELFLRLLCEQSLPGTPPGAAITGVVVYEGLNNMTVINVSPKTFLVALYSSFATEETLAVFGGQQFFGRAAAIRMVDANHYGPNDFVEENRNQRPLCTAERAPPENEFTTSRLTQDRVVVSVAEATLESYNVFARGMGMERLTELAPNRDVAVDEVRIF